MDSMRIGSRQAMCCTKPRNSPEEQVLRHAAQLEPAVAEMPPRHPDVADVLPKLRASLGRMNFSHEWAHLGVVEYLKAALAEARMHSEDASGDGDAPSDSGDVAQIEATVRGLLRLPPAQLEDKGFGEVCEALKSFVQSQREEGMWGSSFELYMGPVMRHLHGRWLSKRT